MLERLTQAAVERAIKEREPGSQVYDGESPGLRLMGAQGRQLRARREDQRRDLPPRVSDNRPGRRREPEDGNGALDGTAPGALARRGREDAEGERAYPRRGHGPVTGGSA